jgi:hypothetical protein
MGKMKEKFIDLQNEQRNMPDDTDWNYQPQPLETNERGLNLYQVNGYRIWAENYTRAVELCKIIDSF